MARESSLGMKVCKQVSIRSIVSSGLVLACVALSAAAAPRSDTEGYGPLRDASNNVVPDLKLTFTKPLPAPAVVDGVAEGSRRKWAPQKGSTWYFVDGQPISFSDYESHYSGNNLFKIRSNKTICSLTVINKKAKPEQPSGSFTIPNPRLWYNGCGYAPSAHFTYGDNNAYFGCHTTARGKALNIIFFMADGCMIGAHTTNLEDMRGAVGGSFGINPPQPAPTAQAAGQTVADGAAAKSAPLVTPWVPDHPITWGASQRQAH